MIAKVVVAVFFVGLKYGAYHSFAKNDVIPENMIEGIVSACYPNGDYSRLYFGEVVACYMEQE